MARARHAYGESGPTDDGLGLPSNFLEAPPALALAKRKQAKESGDWTATFIGTLAAGIDSNIDESPNNPRSSALGGFGARVEALKYVGDAHRFKLTAEATGLPQAKSTSTSRYEEHVGVFYAFDPTPGLQLTSHVSAEHHDGSATTIEGDELNRDLEYFAWDATHGLTYDFTRHQAMRLSYTVEGRDYMETANMFSLDWWKHGPRISYEAQPFKALRLDAFYSFAAQYYFDNPATTVSGAEVPANPDEEHFFHKVGGGAEWTLWRNVPVSLSYSYKVKDDRYQNFESYSGHTVELTADWSPLPRWIVQAAGWFGHRDFQERSASDGGTLEYDRWTAYLGNSYRISDHMTVFIDYEFDYRNTNRSSDFTTFRDYAVHRALVGWSVAY